jgi:hypothetical protein
MHVKSFVLGILKWAGKCSSGRGAVTAGFESACGKMSHRLCVMQSFP